jgi:superfamily II DNA or RNA helicase
MDAFFRAVRGACSPLAWSRGVRLSRGAVVLSDTGSEDDEILVRVPVPGRVVVPEVSLVPAEADWYCDCPDRSAACEHVAAAVIALRDARRHGAGAQPSEDGARPITYRLVRGEEGLGLERGIMRGEEFLRLEGSLENLASGREEAPTVLADDADRRLEERMRGQGRGPRELPRLLRALGRCADLRLDGKSVRVSLEPVLPSCRVEDHGRGFRLGVAEHPEVTERFRNGLALCGDVLRPAGEPELTARERQDLVRGRVFEGDAVTELVTEILPSLGRRLPVDVRSERLPAARDEAPRLLLDLREEEGVLLARADVVYGASPRARVREGGLEALAGRLPLRDERAERELARRVGRELGLAPGVEERLEAEEAVALVERLREWEGETRGEGHRSFFRAPPLEARLSVGEDDFELVFEAPSGDDTAARRGRARLEARPVLRAWEKGRELVRLPGGGWSPLPRGWLESHGRLVADLLEAREAADRLPTASLPDLARLCEETGTPAPPAFERLRALVEDFSEIPSSPLPGDLEAELRPYQRRGVDWLSFLREAGLGALLADDMGLGKTLQALCALRGRSLVVAPTSVLHNWADEARRFRPGLRVAVYHGPGRALDPEADLTVTSYALLRLDRERLAAQAWDTVVLDESQAVKNPASQVARAAFSLRASFRLALSGTPVENRLEELWSQMRFLNPGLLGEEAGFRRRYARPIAAGEAIPARRLRRRLRPFLLRRLKSEVAPELPPRSDVVLRCELGEEERRVYQAVRAATREEVVRKLRAGGGALEALEALLRLRQAACHPSLVPGHEAESSAKLDLLLTSLETAAAAGHRALVFSQWTSLLDLVEPRLGAAGIGHLRLDGATRDRAGVVAGFRAEGGPPVLLASLKAGGTGLNLSEADHVFILDPWWNPFAEDQAADRAHRIGQERPVLVYRLVAAETVEERILELQRRKRALASLATDEAVAARELTRDDLLALLD